MKAEYDAKFWELLKAYPEVEEAFRTTGCDWNQLGTNSRRLCKAIDEFAWAHVMLNVIQDEPEG